MTIDPWLANQNPSLNRTDVDPAQRIGQKNSAHVRDEKPNGQED